MQGAPTSAVPPLVWRIHITLSESMHTNLEDPLLQYLHNTFFNLSLKSFSDKSGEILCTFNKSTPRCNNFAKHPSDV